MACREARDEKQKLADSQCAIGHLVHGPHCSPVISPDSDKPYLSITHAFPTELCKKDPYKLSEMLEYTPETSFNSCFLGASNQC